MRNFIIKLLDLEPESVENIDIRKVGKAYSSITNTTLIAILENLRHYTATYTKIADKYAISVRTVIRIFDNHVQIRRHHLTDIICIDEFYFNRHSRYKYAFMIMSFRNKLILDIVESRRQETLSDYFHSIPLMERKSVKYVSMDMYRPYKDICAMYLPNASICIDSFHVMKKMSDSLVDIPLVLHGTSGVPDDQVRECIKRGICKVNYATDLRIAFSKGVKAYLADHPDAIDPKKYNAQGREEVKTYVMNKIKVCGSVDKA